MACPSTTCISAKVKFPLLFLQSVWRTYPNIHPAVMLRFGRMRNMISTFGAGCCQEGTHDCPFQPWIWWSGSQIAQSQTGTLILTHHFRLQIAKHTPRRRTCQTEGPRCPPLPRQWKLPRSGWVLQQNCHPQHWLHLAEAQLCTVFVVEGSERCVSKLTLHVYTTLQGSIHLGTKHIFQA